MRFKKSLIILALLIILLSITTVSAIDNEDVQISEDNDQPLEEINADAITSTQEDILNAKAKGTFTQLQEIINLTPAGSTINLDKDYSYDEGFDTKGIAINKNLTINGNGHTLNGLSKSRIFLINFELNKNNKIVLNDIKITNGYTDYYGGAILNFGNLTITKCTFTNNRAKYCGGAIASIGHVEYKNSVFNKNTAIEGDGGAVLTVSLLKSIDYFINASSNIDITKDINSILELILKKTITLEKENVKSCTFKNNVAKGRGGGAIYAFGPIDIASSTFTSNKASSVGGAVFANKDLYIKNSKFNENSAKKYGGAVYFRCHEIGGNYVNGKWVSGTVTYYKCLIENSKFIDNVAKARGGAIYGFRYNDSDKTHGAKAVKCSFDDNLAKSGKHIYGGSKSKCTFKETTITLNKVTVKKSASKLVLTATLKKNSSPLKSKKITFKFKGKTYTAKTNKKGVAKVTIKSSVLKNLKVGTQVGYKASYKKTSVVTFTTKRTAIVKK